jgi:hypothetical protein
MGILKIHKAHRIAAACLLLANLWCFAPAQAQNAAPSIQLYEQKIKAGLVYNFLKYTNWPADVISKTNGSLRVCLLGDDAFNGYLYPLQGRTAQQYLITITEINSIPEATGCSLVFVHRSAADMLPSLLQSLKGKHVLTISDIDQFARQGGMIEFGMEDQRVALLINKKAVGAAGLTIQERLVKLAKPVSDRNG